MLVKLFTGLLTASFLVRAAPSPDRLGSDLTILINNDLAGPQSPFANSGVILLTPRSKVSAASACAALGEQLWSPELSAANTENHLEYLSFQAKYGRDQQYWIAPEASDVSVARAIDGRGRVANISTLNEHLKKLPAFCSQSAPFSNETYQDTSSRWQTTVRSNNEYITGFRDRLSFRFLGIRYAAQPKRFTHSSPYKGKGNNASALSYGAQCLQQRSGGSEDCLFLNIWTPHLPAHGGDDPEELKPVMFWIHGGAFTSGTANDPTFDGGNIASRGDVVMVAINYRLSTLGFLALDDGVTKGNYGLADQINALDWVRKNIEKFGGDSKRITIFGQSAGAASVRALLASPKAAGKFKGAIQQSNLGGGGYGTTYSSWLDFKTQMSLASTSILKETNCSTAASKVDCLRNISATALVTGTQARYLTVDGTYLTSSELLLDYRASDSLSKVHLMEGLMRDDSSAIISYINTTNLTKSLEDVGFDASKIVSSPLIPLPVTSNTTLDVFNVTSRVATDSIFRCIDQASSYAGVWNKVFAPNQYFYEFNRSYQTYGWDPNTPLCDAPKTASQPNGDPSLEYFKCHSGELYYVFGTITRTGLPLRDDNDLPFSQFILDSWASFARSYDPNPNEGFLKARGYTNTTNQINVAGEWKPVGPQGHEMRQLQWPSKQVGFRDVEQCGALGWPLDYYLRSR